MRQSEIAKRYSLALFELGKEGDKLFIYRDELGSFIQIMEEYLDFKKLFFHPRVKREDKKHSCWRRSSLQIYPGSF